MPAEARKPQTTTTQSENHTRHPQPFSPIKTFASYGHIPSPPERPSTAGEGQGEGNRGGQKGGAPQTSTNATQRNPPTTQQQNPKNPHNRINPSSDDNLTSRTSVVI